MNLLLKRTMNKKNAFGINIASEIDIPEFLPTDMDPEVYFRLGTVHLPFKVKESPIRVITSTEEGILLYWSEIGTFLVKDGSEVIIDPIEGVDESLIKLVLTGPVIGVILHQRGFKVFHSSVVYSRAHDVTVAFVASKGEGKSTMAAAMYNNGYKAMSDDIMAVFEQNGSVFIQPGFPQFKLWEESANKLVKEQKELKIINTIYNKRVRNVMAGFNSECRKLDCIFHLEFGNELKIDPLIGTDALMALLPHWYGALFRGQLLESFGKENHFKECVYLSKKVPIYRCLRPKSFEVMNNVVQTIDTFIAKYRVKNETYQ